MVLSHDAVLPFKVKFLTIPRLMKMEIFNPIPLDGQEQKPLEKVAITIAFTIIEFLKKSRIGK